MPKNKNPDTVEYTEFTQVVEPLVVVKTPAQYSLEALNAAIAEAEPTVQVEIKYVEDRLQYLLAKHGNAAIYALMRQNLKIAIEKGQ